jgi:hypothetical protein
MIMKTTNASEEALLLAGLMADCAIRLVGGQDLNGTVPAAHPDDFSYFVKHLRISVERYNRHIMSMNSND